MNPFGLQYICTREQNKESPYTASLSQTSKNAMFLLLYFMFFFYIDMRAGQVLTEGG
jgi:hypothetical protein